MMVAKTLIKSSGWWATAIITLFLLIWLFSIIFESQDNHVYVQNTESREVYAHVIFRHENPAPAWRIMWSILPG